MGGVMGVVDRWLSGPAQPGHPSAPERNLSVRGYPGLGLNLDLRIYDLVLDFLQER